MLKIWAMASSGGQGWKLLPCVINFLWGRLLGERGGFGGILQLK